MRRWCRCRERIHGTCYAYHTTQMVRGDPRPMAFGLLWRRFYHGIKGRAVSREPWELLLYFAFST